MPQSLSDVNLHLIFSTKERYPFLDHEIRDSMHRYLSTLCRDLGSTCRKVGGVSDHIHIVTSLPRTLSQSQLLEDIKKKSSKNKEIDDEKYGKFAWQAGYGAFSVSRSNLDEVVSYVANQEKHHQQLSFQDEYRAFLTKHQIEHDERYVWD